MHQQTKSGIRTGGNIGAGVGLATGAVVGRHMKASTARVALTSGAHLGVRGAVLGGAIGAYSAHRARVSSHSGIDTK